MQRCALCWSPVNLDKATKTPEGEPAHLSCVQPKSAEEELLREIFGDLAAAKRQGAGPEIMAEQFGHRMSWTGKQGGHSRPWACSCGLSGRDGRGGRKRHADFVILQQEETPRRGAPSRGTCAPWTRQ